MSHRGSQAERLVEDYGRKLAIKEGVLAVGLFGSYARGDVRATSDVDVLTVVSGDHWAREKHKVGRLELDVLQCPLSMIEEALCQRAPLVGVSMLVAILREVQPIFDEKGVLEELARSAARFTWSQEQLRQRRRAIDNSKSLSSKYADQRKYSKATLQLLALSHELAQYRLMQRGWVKVIKPRDLLNGLRLHDHGFLAAFIEANGLDAVTSTEVRSLVTRLASWKDWVSRRVTMNGREDLFRHGEAIPSSEVELKSASDCLEERDIEGAALQVRCATVVLCGAVTKLLPTYPREMAEVYAERYEAARMLNPRFADFLLQVHGVDGSHDQYRRTKRSLTSHRE